MQTWSAVAWDGFGVAIVSGISTVAYSHFKKEKDTSSHKIVGSMITGSTVAGRDITIINIGQPHVSSPSSTPSAAEEDYREHPTPMEMRAEIGKQSAIYAQEAVAKTYRGVKVNWSGTLQRMSAKQETRTGVVMDVGGEAVKFWVNINHYALLKTVRQGEPLTIHATVELVARGVVNVKDVKLKFHQSQPPESESELPKHSEEIIDLEKLTHPVATVSSNGARSHKRPRSSKRKPKTLKRKPAVHDSGHVRDAK